MAGNDARANHVAGRRAVLGGLAAGGLALLAAGQPSFSPWQALARSPDRYRIPRRALLAADDAASLIQLVVTAARQDGASIVELPPGDPGEYLCRSPIETHGIRLAGDRTTLTVAADMRALLTATGSRGPEHRMLADHRAGSSTLVVPPAMAEGMRQGDLVGIESRSIVTGPRTVGTSQEGLAAEYHRIVGRSGATLALDTPLAWDHIREEGARAFRVAPVRQPVLEGMTVTATSPTELSCRAVLLRDTLHGVIDVDAGQAAGGIHVLNSMHAQVRSTVWSLPNRGDHRGYGVAISGTSAHVDVELSGGGCRHLFTTLADEREAAGGRREQWGGPREVRVTGRGTGDARSLAIWDTHPYGQRILFDRCEAVGGGSEAPGFQVRSADTILDRCSSTGSGDTACKLQAGVARGAQVRDSVLESAARHGLGLCEEAVVTRCVVRGNGSAGIVIVDDCSGAVVSDCEIVDNAFGVHDQSSGGNRGVVVQRCTIDRGERQDIGMLTPRGGLSITDTAFRGYATLADAVREPGPGVRITRSTLE
ncbi:right-handed parallel beta-helix repeat-containing protein [Lolliginicoccus suaedae]|uniref:right-handed parallel beta-helix repeat-containing protein n=1 Tax=Lolliginicoccus suaedae TaxID=2605429 RepID=UPI0011F06C85|nr:right-handed parallel beta-helix repeat-containing protein [Lolliginicoccus suaedae]